ncbi:MAG: hypothetical protein E2P02_02160 [Acidobacteria bacterium]|nr:MAG: hypothetical protein E2P02_02160 [Acidobacteriota bacterium]
MRMWKASMLLAALFWVATAGTVAAPKAPVASGASVADAAMGGDVVTLRALLEQGSDVNARFGDGMTGLHWAARKGNAAIAEVLIGAGADLEATTRIGAHTPLHVASAAGRASVVKGLLLAGANANAITTTGATPLHFAAASGSALAVAALVEHGAKVNAAEPHWGQTALMFAAAAGRTEVVEVLLEGEADPSIAAKVVDLVERNEYDQSERRERNKRIAKLRAAAMKNAPIDSNTPGETETEPEDRDEALRRGGEPVPLDYAALIATHGGLTPLLLAAREGHVGTALALIKGTADINQVSAADNTSPMLIAMFNGHFDLAMQLFERGADPSVASDAGATPLYAALNMHWAPKARHPQPVAYMQQELTYLEVMETLLKAGVDPNVRLKKTLWYTTYNRDLLGVNRAGATPFWRAAHALDIDAMRLLLAHGADPNMPTLKIPERKRRDGDNTDHSGLPPVPMGGPAVYPIHAASGVGHGQGFAGNSHRHVPDGWLPAVKFLVEELGAEVNVRDYKGYNTVHHAAARGDNELIQYLVSKGADVTFVSRKGQTTADMANGPVQRVQPYPETVALLESLGATNNHKCVSC